DEFVRSKPVQALFPKVKITTVDASDALEPLFAPEDEVTVRFADGRSLASGPVRYAKGHAKNPIGLDELREKFDDCLGGSLPSGRRDGLFQRLAGLEKLPQAGALYNI